MSRVFLKKTFIEAIYGENQASFINNELVLGYGRDLAVLK
jgi:hypothetical protein